MVHVVSAHAFKFTVASAFCCGALAGTAQAAPPAKASTEFEQVVLPYLNEHCIRCHGDKEQKGELRIDTLSRDFSAGAASGRWNDIIERISAGEMPPEGEPQPSSDESSKIVETIAKLLKDGESSRLPQRDRVSFHKLTPDEYAQMIFDLLDAPFNATDSRRLDR